MSSRISYAEAAAHIGIHRGTLRTMVHRKQVPHIRISARVVVFDLAELDAWIDAHRVPVAAVTTPPRL